MAVRADETRTVNPGIPRAASVSTGPGEMMLHRILRGPSSAAIQEASERTKGRHGSQTGHCLRQRRLHLRIGDRPANCREHASSDALAGPITLYPSAALCEPM